jgi:hypothetical protein
MEHHHRKAWATARDAREELGISERTLARWRASGLLKPGKHWRRKFPTPNSPVLYPLPSCEETMGEATARSADLLERAVGPTRPQRHGSPCLRSMKVKQAG